MPITGPKPAKGECSFSKWKMRHPGPAAAMKGSSLWGVISRWYAIRCAPISIRCAPTYRVKTATRSPNSSPPAIAKAPTKMQISSRLPCVPKATIAITRAMAGSKPATKAGNRRWPNRSKPARLPVSTIGPLYHQQKYWKKAACASNTPPASRAAPPAFTPPNGSGRSCRPPSPPRISNFIPAPRSLTSPTRAKTTP